jgi:hypothetical protein
VRRGDRKLVKLAGALKCLETQGRLRPEWIMSMSTPGEMRNEKELHTPGIQPGPSTWESERASN